MDSSKDFDMNMCEIMHEHDEAMDELRNTIEAQDLEICFLEAKIKELETKLNECDSTKGAERL